MKLTLYVSGDDIIARTIEIREEAARFEKD